MYWSGQDEGEAVSEAPVGQARHAAAMSKIPLNTRGRAYPAQLVP